MAITSFFCKRHHKEDEQEDVTKQEFVKSIETYMGGSIRERDLRNHPTLSRALTHVDSGEWDLASRCLSKILSEEHLSMAEPNRV